MSNNDDDLDLESGLGHDPLEWLQDDEDSAVTVQSEATGIAPEAQESNQGIAQSESNAGESEAIVSEATTSSENESTESQAQDVVAAVPSQQSFRYENHKAFLTVPVKLAIQVIESMHSEWKTLLYDLPQSIVIDASNTKEIDAAGLQLLYAIVQQLAFKGTDVVIVAVNPVLERQMTLFGLRDFFAQYEHAA